MLLLSGCRFKWRYFDDDPLCEVVSSGRHLVRRRVFAQPARQNALARRWCLVGPFDGGHCDWWKNCKGCGHYMEAISVLTSVIAILMRHSLPTDDDNTAWWRTLSTTVCSKQIISTHPCRESTTSWASHRHDRFLSSIRESHCFPGELATAISFEGSYWEECRLTGISSLNRVNCSLGHCLSCHCLFATIFSSWTCRTVSMYHNVSLFLSDCQSECVSAVWPIRAMPLGIDHH